jgi:hypothetical protein
MARLEAQHGGLGLAYHQVAVDRPLGGMAELLVRATSAAAASAATEVHSLGLQKRFVKGHDVHPVTTILLAAHVVACPHQIGLGDIAEFLDLVEQIGAGEYGIKLVAFFRLKLDRTTRH